MQPAHIETQSYPPVIEHRLNVPKYVYISLLYHKFLGCLTIDNLSIWVDIAEKNFDRHHCHGTSPMTLNIVTVFWDIHSDLLAAEAVHGRGDLMKLRLHKGQGLMGSVKVSTTLRNSDS